MSLRRTGVAVVSLALVAIVSVGIEFAGQNGVHPVPTRSPDQADVRIPAGFVSIGVGGPRFHVLGQVRTGDRVDIAATVDTRWFSRADRRQVTRGVFTTVPVMVDAGSPGELPSYRLTLSQCNAEFMSWFASHAVAITATPTRTSLSRPDPEYVCGLLFADHMGSYESHAVDDRWHFSIEPADPEPVIPSR